MLIGEFLRNKAFVLYCKVKHKNLMRYIDQLQCFADSDCQVEQIDNNLIALLKSAQTFVPYYKVYAGNFNLSTYPVINKRFIKTHYELFQTPNKVFSRKIKVNTSGSYGTPLDYYFNPEKKLRQTAEVLYYGSKSGYFVGQKHGLFMSIPGKSKFKYWLQNELFFSSKVLNEQFLKESRIKLKDTKISFLIGFPSAISLLAQYVVDCGDTPDELGIKGVITCSENLDEQKRNIISKAFQCTVHNRYSTEELGVLAYQKESNKGFEINNAHYIIELLDLNEDKPVEVGEVGRVVVTDLFSNAMPLIRYETGDLAKLKDVYSERPQWVKSFSKFSGRSIQIVYNTIGEKLYPLFLDSIMENYSEINQYQFVQHGQKVYELRLVLALNSSFSAQLEKSLYTNFKNWLGEDATIDVHLAHDIQALPSGKRPYVINNFTA